MAEKVGLSPDEAVKHAGFHLKNGNVEQAQRISEMILAAMPDHAGAINIMGVISLDAGKHEQAIEHFKRALSLNEVNDGIWFNIGLAYTNSFDYEKAIYSFLKALDLNPDNDVARSHLVECYAHSGLYQDALDHIFGRLREKPEDINALILLERLSLETGRFGLAHRTLKKLLELVPDSDTDIKLEIASLLITSNFPGRAKKWIDEVLLADPDNKPAQWVYGEMLQQSGLTDQAITYFEKAAEGHLMPVQNRLSIANAYIELGRKDDAKAIVDTVLKENPKFLPAYLVASQVQERGLTSQQVDYVLELKEKLAIKDDVAIENIEYALATTANQEKRYGEAFEHYRVANKLHKKILENQKRGYNRKVTEERFHLVKEIFTPELFDKFADFGNSSQIPVFIAGMPRSGTTLTEQIIGAHSKAAGVGELMDIPHLGILIREFTKNVKSYPECLPDLEPKYIHALSNGYLNRLKDWQPDALRIVNKLPGNFVFLGLIRILFPKAPIIHCVRDPRDTLISCFIARFGPGLAYSFDLDDLVHQYDLYRDLMDHWERVLPNGMYQSYYKDLVSQPEDSTARLLEYCALDYEPTCLDFHKADTTVRTASFLQVRKPIYTSSLDRWRRYEGHIDELMHLCLPEKIKQQA